jgi:hypothetical protein
VASLGPESPEAAERVRDLLKLFEKDGLDPGHLHEIPCFEHATESRHQSVELLASHPLKPGDLVVGMGADHCWTSSLLLDQGCRVIAVDMQWSQVSFERNVINIPASKAKSKRSRDIPITANVKAVLEMRRIAPLGRAFGSDAYVFGNAVGEKVR